MVRTHGHLDSPETNEAAWVATRGAVIGAARVCFLFLRYRRPCLGLRIVDTELSVFVAFHLDSRTSQPYTCQCRGSRVASAKFVPGSIANKVT